MNFKGAVLIVLAAAAWGMGGVAGQYLFQYCGADPVWLVMVRQILAGFMFLAYAGCVQKRNIFAMLRDEKKDLTAYSFFGVLGAQLGFYYTISLCNAATATVLQYTAPVFVMIWMSHVKRKMPEGRELLGIVFALIGVFLLATHGSIKSLALSPAAVGVGILSSLAYAYYTVKPAEMLKKYTAASLIGWGQLISGLALIILCNPFDPPGTWDAGAVMAFTYLLFGATILSYSVYLAGLKLVGPTKASLISCAEPLASIAAVVTLLGTKLTVEDYLGMACIIFTVTMLSLPKK